MIDDRTSSLNLPKPNKDNTLLEDVQRLRDALDGADSAIAGKAAAIHGHAITDVTGLQTALDGKAAAVHTHAITDVTGLQTALDSKQAALGYTAENTANKGAANGYAGLDSGGKVPAAQLPSYVDDVLEYTNLAGFPGTGETAKIYVALDTNKTYRWSGSAYVEISPSPGSTDSITEGSTNLYFTTSRAKMASVYGALSKSAAYTVVQADAKSLIRTSTTSGAVTITLPQISTLTQDFDILVAKVTSDANIVSIARSGADTINGATTYNLTSQWAGAWLIADRSTNTWTVISSGTSTGVNTIVETFTGSGTAGPFTLSGDPGSKNNTAVFVGGVYQQKSTYTLSGTSLTLGGTVASGVAIEVIWSTPLSIGTPADGTVTTAKLADSNVTTAKIADNAVTAAKVASDVATTSGTQTLSGKTLVDPIITGTITEDIFTLTDGATVDIDPGNGSIQTLTLTGTARTLTYTNMVNGEAVTLMINDGSAGTITTWNLTWVNNGGSNPTLSLTGYTVVVVWKVAGVVYGALVGNA